jgi:2-hydroxy-3-keto-5-methylthiopentenyl-1-phosphate phosphatase
VFVGDGVSDRKAALLADRLFAKRNLADWCELAGVPYEPFESLADVHTALLG